MKNLESIEYPTVDESEENISSASIEGKPAQEEIRNPRKEMGDTGEEIAESLSDEGAYSFLTQKARDKEFELSQEQVGALLEKALKHLSQKEFGFSEAIEFVSAISHQSWKWEEGKEFLVEKVFRALPEEYKKHPEIVHELENIIGQEYFIRPEVFLDVASKAYTDADIDTYLRSDLVHSFNYQYSFAGDGYDQAIKKSLNFENPKSYRQAAETLNFLRNLSIVSGDNEFSEDIKSRIESILKEKNQERKGNFLLNLRAQFLYNDLHNGHPERWSIDRSEWPYKISKTNYGYVENGSIYSIDADVPEVDNLMKTINEELLYARPEKGKNRPDIINKYKERVENIKRRYSVPFRKTNTLSNKSDVEVMDYEYLIGKLNARLFENMTGVDIANLSVEEQFELLHYLKSKNIEEAKEFKKFSEKYGETGLKTFLSLEYGRDFGDKIVQIGQKLSEESAKQLFAKYAEIVDAANDASEELNKATKGGDKADNGVLEKVRGNLLKYGRKLLENFANTLDSKGREKRLEPLLEQLSQTKADIVLSAVVFKSLASEGVNIEEIVNVSLETLRRENLTNEDKEEMARVFHANREEYPEDLRKIVAEDFYKILTTGEREFHIMRKEKDIVAFARFDELPNGNLYIGSLNVRPEIKSLTVGGTFLTHLIKQRNADYTLEAEAYSGNKMLPNYTGKYGFKIVAEIPNYKGSKHLFYKLEIPKGSQAKS